MTAELGTAVYGKDGIRLLCVSGHEVAEATVRVLVSGGPEESYLAGDNSRVVTTDTMGGVATATLARTGIATAEDAALAVTAAIRGHYPFLPRVEAEVSVVRWERLSDSSGHHQGPGPGFARPGWPCDRAAATSSTDGTTLVSGWTGPPLLLTRGSRFTGFVQDERTPNQPAQDRAIAGDLDLRWSVAGLADHSADHSAVRAAVCAAALGAFEVCRSESVQHMLTLMARRVLEENPLVRSVEARMDGIPLSLVGGADGVCRAYVVGAQPRPHTQVALRRASWAGQPAEGRLS
jgi:urate oxidase